MMNTEQLAIGGFIETDPSRPVSIDTSGCDYVISNHVLRRAGINPAQLHAPVGVGWFVPDGTDICPHCGDTNFNEADRLCISCNHDHPEHDTLDCEQFCRR